MYFVYSASVTETVGRSRSNRPRLLAAQDPTVGVRRSLGALVSPLMSSCDVTGDVTGVPLSTEPLTHRAMAGGETGGPGAGRVVGRWPVIGLPVLQSG